MVLHWILSFGMLMSLPNTQSPISTVQSQVCAAHADNVALDCQFPGVAMCEQSMNNLGGVCMLFPPAANSLAAAEVQ
ncbi:MAG TPA: hypothetical protein VEF90_06090 [Xanthobacteraceae bacterium]|nr:hypothetical protein [Xanthobacteraceae bacterium]